jgi:hypothetical protein
MCRPPFRPSASFQHSLNLYAIGASAAGVALLALAPPAEGKVVYTPAHMKLTGEYTPIDLNHDGTNDFAFWIYGGHSTSIATSFLAIYALPGNAAVGTAVGWFRNAVALKKGNRVGPHRLFNGTNAGQMANHITKLETSHHNTYWAGQWANGGKGLKNRYLGFKFLISNQVHYGWARVSVRINGKAFTGTLNGYAYETIPNKPITAGRTKGPDVVTQHTGTLGALAAGSK